ncbi:MAG: hypothetical protein U0T56_03310 [Ferruginibacter sp.]
MMKVARLFMPITAPRILTVTGTRIWHDRSLTRRLTDSTWNRPDNLGYPINTIDDEGSLVAADGQTTYYASDKVRAAAA